MLGFGNKASAPSGAEVLTGQNGNGVDPTIQDATGMTMPFAEESHAIGIYNHSRIEKACGTINDCVNSFDIRHQFPHDEPDYHRMITGIASLCAPKMPIPGKTTFSAKTVNGILGPHIRDRFPDADATDRLATIAENIDLLICKERFIFGVSTSIAMNEGLDKVTPQSKFQLVSIIANYDNRSSTPEDRGAVYALAYQEAHCSGDKLGFASEMNQELKDGNLDGCLARELVVTALQNKPVTKKDRRQAQGITRAVDFAKQMSGKSEVDDDLLDAMTSPTALEAWPAEAKQVLVEKRGEIANAVEMNLSKAEKKLRERGFIFPKIERQALEAGFASYYKKLDKQDMAELGVAKVLKHKRMMNGSTPSEASQSKKLTPEKPKRKIFPNKVLARDKDGNHIKLSAEDMIEMAKEAFSVDAALEQDIENIFKYIRKINLKSPGGCGMKRIERHKKGADGKPFYEFKPGEATGLPTTTKITRRLRVIFSLENNKFIIHGIVNRDKLDSSLKIIDRKINAPKGHQLRT